MNDPAMTATEKIIEAFPALRGQMLHGMPTIIRDAYAETLAELAFRPLGDNHHNAAACPHCGNLLAEKDAEIAEWKRSHQAREEQAVVDRTNIHCLTTERDRLAAEVERLKTASGEEDQELDGTDFAHPAYWRGEEVAVHVLCQHLNEIMDGKSIGSGIAREPWESTRRRVERLTRQVEELLSALRNMLGMFDTPHARLLFRKAWTDMHSEACRGARAAIDAALKEQP